MYLGMCDMYIRLHIYMSEYRPPLYFSTSTKKKQRREQHLLVGNGYLGLF